MVPSWDELNAKTDEEIIDMYNDTAKQTSSGLNYYTKELNRRSNEKTNKIMVKCTLWITIMTAVMLMATIANVIIAICN